LGFPQAMPLIVDLSQLNAGLHFLGFRTRDAGGRWSDVALLPVQAKDAATLTPTPATLPVADTSNLLFAAEFFWDADPGTGQGTNVAVNFEESVRLGFPTVSPLSADISQLTSGLHQFGFRTRDASTRWSDVMWFAVQVKDASILIPSVSGLPVSDAANLL